MSADSPLALGLIIIAAALAGAAAFAAWLAIHTALERDMRARTSRRRTLPRRRPPLERDRWHLIGLGIKHGRP